MYNHFLHALRSSSGFHLLFVLRSQEKTHKCNLGIQSYNQTVLTFPEKKGSLRLIYVQKNGRQHTRTCTYRVLYRAHHDGGMRTCTHLHHSTACCLLILSGSRVATLQQAACSTVCTAASVVTRTIVRGRPYCRWRAAWGIFLLRGRCALRYVMEYPSSRLSLCFQEKTRCMKIRERLVINIAIKLSFSEQNGSLRLAYAKKNGR